MPKILFIFALVGALIMGGCDRALSNVTTLISNDCGVSWDEIKAGETVPGRIGVCELKVQVPGYPMAGDAKFRTSFANNVLADVSIAYEYTIDNAKLFILDAKYLGKQNTNADTDDSSATKYESAENTIIDRRIRDATTALLSEQDIVNFDQGKLEDVILDTSNERLAERGVKLAAISFVVTPDNQTRQAMDVVSARRVYSAAAIPELGDQVIVSRAGASQITIGQ